jgi:arabinan endo-1,5-alpha-L-arabinosidase
VENTVFAPVAGSYTLHVGYANGSASTASHGLVVNGNNAGWNTIRLTKGDQYTEVDYLELQ